MGCEICKLEDKQVFVLYDNTSGIVLDFNDFDTLVEATEKLGRVVKESFTLNEVVFEFENRVCYEWDNDDNEIENEIQKIKDYWGKNE